MSDEQVLRLLPLVFLGIGAGLLGLGARALLRTRAFLARARPAIGKVLELKAAPAREPGDPRTLAPVVEFTTAAHQLIRFESLVHSSPPEHEVGASVPVLYDPGRPTEARIRSFSDLWLIAAVLGGLGLAFATLGAGLLALGVLDH